MLPANNDFKALPPKVSSSSSAFAKNNNPQFHQQQNVNGQLLQKPTKIPSKEAFTFHHQPPAQVPESTIEIMAQQIEQILMEDREKLKAQFDVHLANIEVQYKEKIIQLENSSNLQKASIFSLQTQNKMLIEQLEKYKQEMSSKEIEQQNELAAKTSLIKGLQNVVKLVSDQLTEARKTEPSNGQKSAELEQEMELKNPTISPNADTTICGRPCTSSSSLMLGIGSSAEPEQLALATSFNQIGRVKEEPVADDVNMEEADQQKQRPPSSAAKNDNDKNGGGQNNA